MAASLSDKINHYILYKVNYPDYEVKFVIHAASVSPLSAYTKHIYPTLVPSATRHSYDDFPTNRCLKHEVLSTNVVGECTRIETPFQLHQKEMNCYVSSDGLWGLEIFEKRVQIVLLKSIKRTQIASLIQTIDGTIKKYTEFLSYVPKSRELFKRQNLQFKMPVALLKNSLKEIRAFDYLYTPKLDGVRRMLYIASTTCILSISRDRRISYHFGSWPPELLDVVLDTELFQDVFFVFDCLHGGQLYNDNLSDISEKITTIKLIVAMLDTSMFKEKEYYNCIEECLTSIHYNQSSCYDGIILMPKASSGADVYKYKFVPTMDLKYDHFNSNLYVRTAQEYKSIHLLTETPFRPFIYLEHMHNWILECSWDVKKKEWHLHQARFDKTEPNYYTTAQDVWNQIQFRCSEEDLIKWGNLNFQLML